jgi:uroporphyrinogen decarboxylase
MTAREVFDDIVHFRRPPRTPLLDLEGVAEQTFRLWVRQGHVPPGAAREGWFDYDGGLASLRFDGVPIPAFRGETLEDDGRFVTFIDKYGNTVRREKARSVTPTNYVYLDGPVHSRADWQAMKERFDPADPRRLPLEWSDGFLDALNAADAPTCLAMSWGPGRGIKNGYMLGFDRFLRVAAEEPALLEEIFEFWADFVIRFLSPFIDRLTIDWFLFIEDGLGYSSSSLVSPQVYRRTWLPHVRRAVEFLRGRGVGLVGHYSSGNLKPLMPVLLEAGFNLFGPLEAAAGMDALELRGEYGRDAVLMGNLSRTSLSCGHDAIREEVMRKVPPLIDSGGYFPAADDLIMPDVAYQDYVYFMELVRSI